MKVCAKAKATKTNNSKYIPGHLYKWEDIHIYIAISSTDIMHLETGVVYSNDSPLGSIDVTDKYCLQEI